MNFVFVQYNVKLPFFIYSNFSFDGISKFKLEKFKIISMSIQFLMNKYLTEIISS